MTFVSVTLVFYTSVIGDYWWLLELIVMVITVIVVKINAMSLMAYNGIVVVDDNWILEAIIIRVGQFGSLSALIVDSAMVDNHY